MGTDGTETCPTASVIKSDACFHTAISHLFFSDIRSILQSGNETLINTLHLAGSNKGVKIGELIIFNKTYGKLYH